LIKKGISNEDYTHAQDVWQAFKFMIVSSASIGFSITAWGLGNSWFWV